MQREESVACTRCLVVITADHTVSTLCEPRVLIYSKAARKPAFVKANRASELMLLLPGDNAS